MAFAEHRRVYSHTYDEDTRQLSKGFYEDTFIGQLHLLKGALSDGASGPIFTLNMLGLSRFDPEIERAVWVHDLLYGFGKISKADADRIFFDILMADGLDRVRASVLYRAVKWGGKKKFMANAPDIKHIDFLPNTTYKRYFYEPKISKPNRRNRRRPWRR